MSDDAMRVVELCDELEKARRYYLELDDYRKVMQAEIERLRELVAYWHKMHDCEFELRREAADEIERLRQQNEYLSAARSDNCDDCGKVIYALKDEP
jgi:hypothetical protein